MVKIYIVLIAISLSIWADDAYERHCVSCHRELPTSLQRMFMNYLRVYSGEETVKAALKHYMRYPIRDISVMSDLFLDSYGVKRALKVDERELKEAIDIYWEKYKVFGKLQ